jgi:hypothetical protein
MTPAIRDFPYIETRVMYGVLVSYQIISSQHLLLHIWNGTQRLQARKTIFHHKRD